MNIKLKCTLLIIPLISNFASLLSQLMANLTEVTYDFWKSRWDANETGWHRTNISRNIIKYWDLLKPKIKSTVFFPLCGKTLDMLWVLANGHSVVGVEFYEEPVFQFFDENKIEFTVEEQSNYKLYKSIDNNLKIYVQDIFEFGINSNEKFDIIIDRGSFVALKITLRDEYIKLLYKLLDLNGTIYFELLQYDQSIFGGPPFSVSDDDFNILMKNNHLNFQVAHSGEYERQIGGTDLHEIISLASKC